MKLMDQTHTNNPQNVKYPKCISNIGELSDAFLNPREDENK